MATGADSYILLDSGAQKRLERVGAYLLVRPAPTAFWSPRLPEAEWAKAHAVYHRSNEGGGHWEYRAAKLPEAWPVTSGGLTILARPTGFGHIGFFPEQRSDWDFITRALRARGEPAEVMNLFGYTGLTSLIAAKEGAKVCHLDASKGVVAFARENAQAAGLEAAPIRWMVEDAQKFIEREIRRGHRYQGLTLSPPTFGRGAKGETWKIEDHLLDLLKQVRRLLAEDAEFITLNTNSPKFTPLVLQNLLAEAYGDLGGACQGSEMTIAHQAPDTRLLPSGSLAAWWRRGRPF